jgi:hypothetical protein
MIEFKWFDEENADLLYKEEWYPDDDELDSSLIGYPHESTADFGKILYCVLTYGTGIS